MTSETSDPKGWRATPPSLLLGLGVWMLYGVVRFVIAQTLERSPDSMVMYQRLSQIGEGVSFACGILTAFGVFELLSRATPSERAGLKLAAIASSVIVGADVLMTVPAFLRDPWTHEWIWTVYGWVAISSWILFAIGLTLALPAARRALGFATIAVFAATWLPPPLGDKVWATLRIDGVALYALEVVLRCVRTTLLLVLVTKVAHGVTPVNPVAAAQGLNRAGRGLWIRVIAAVAVVLFSLVGVRSGGLSFLRFMLVSQAVVAVIALAMTGVGALRAASTGVREMDPWSMTLGGGLALWGAGVSLAQVPALYRMLYAGEGSYGDSSSRAVGAILSVGLPVVVALGVGILTTAVTTYASRRGNEELRSDAQAAGIGYVALMLVAIAMQSWMLPRSQSMSAFAIVSLLAAGASLWATVMVARLFGRAALVVEAEPGLPAASLV